MIRLKNISTITRWGFSNASSRLTIGAIQGFLFAALSIAIQHKIAPFSHTPIAALARSTLVFIPLLGLLNLGRMRHRSLIVLLAVEALINGCITWHISWLASLTSLISLFSLELTCQVLLLFIVQVLAFSADRDRRWIPHYTTLFEVAWDQVILIILASLFTTLAWGILLLASSLFSTIGLIWLNQQLLKPMIAYPITSITFAGAITLCIGAESMVWGARRLILSLFSILLPIISWLSSAFLITLMLVPHTQSWTTHLSGWLLSTTATILVLLLNALFQDGRHAHLPNRFMRINGRIAAAILLPLIMLTMIPLIERIMAHGWTVERIFAITLLGILTLYGAGYLIAAIRPSGPWLGPIASTNIAVAALSALVFFTLLTPIADPYRLATISQVDRLRDGTIASNAFPYVIFAHDYGPYGRQALQSLMDTPPSLHRDDVQRRARAALNNQYLPPEDVASSKPQNDVPTQPAPSPEPQKPDAGKPDLPPLGCLTSPPNHCHAVVLSPKTDQVMHVAILLDQSETVSLFTRSPWQNWHKEGDIILPLACTTERKALLNGQASFGTITQPVFMIGGAHFQFTTTKPACGD